MQKYSNPTPTKWEAKFSRRLEKSRADQIWPLFEDFVGFNKWFTVVPTSYCIHGTNGEPGCVRYCSAGAHDIKLPGGHDDHSNKSGHEVVCWSKERLVAIDPMGMTLTYEVMESNIGFRSYVATFKVVPAPEDDRGDVVEWYVSVEPLAGCTFEDFVSMYESWLQLILDNMETTIISQSY